MRLGHTARNGPPSTSDAGPALNKSPPRLWSTRGDPAVGDDLSGEVRRGVADEIEHETHQMSGRPMCPMGTDPSMNVSKRVYSSVVADFSASRPTLVPRCQPGARALTCTLSLPGVRHPDRVRTELLATTKAISPELAHQPSARPSRRHVHLPMRSEPTSVGKTLQSTNTTDSNMAGYR
jgi:hypothetical protein